MARPAAKRFQRNIQLATAGACLIVLGAGIATIYTAAQRRITTERKDPIRVLALLARAQRSFIYSDKDGDGRAQPARTLGELVEHELLPAEFNEGPLYGYRYTVAAQGPKHWTLKATPTGPEASKRRHYLRNQDDFVWSASGRPATPEDRLVASPRKPKGY